MQCSCLRRDVSCSLKRNVLYHLVPVLSLCAYVESCPCLQLCITPHQAQHGFISHNGPAGVLSVVGPKLWTKPSCTVQPTLVLATQLGGSGFQAKLATPTATNNTQDSELPSTAPYGTIAACSCMHALPLLSSAAQHGGAAALILKASAQAAARCNLELRLNTAGRLLVAAVPGRGQVAAPC
jgi:hypothetical protein